MAVGFEKDAQKTGNRALGASDVLLFQATADCKN